VLTGDEYGFTHDDVDEIEDVIGFARRAGTIPWKAISDGRSDVAEPWTVRDADTLAQQVLDSIEDAHFDRQEGQRVRVEVWAEAMGWLTRLEQICNDRGVSVHSGSGSVPIPAIRQAALRAIHAFDESRAVTVLLWIGDLDLNGIRNIAQPFAADVQQFAIDILGLTDEAHHSAVRDGLVIVRRLILNAGQVEEHVGQRGRSRPTAKAIAAGWPYPFTVQAEALPPEVRDGIVADAIDSLHDVPMRERIVAAEAGLHADARQELASHLMKEDDSDG
jgi:hypothetical protein